MEGKDPNIDFLTSVKKGTLIKVIFENKRDYMLALAKKVIPRAYGEQWHSIRCYGLYNTRNPLKFDINAVCGCKETSIACKPSLEDYFLFQKMMRGNLVLNRKKL